MSTERCTDVDPDAGQCQLRADHDGLHATAGADAFYTWFANELFAWSEIQPPYWIYGLAWFETLRPIYSSVYAS